MSSPAINKIRQDLGKPTAKALLLYDGSKTHFAVDHQRLFQQHSVILHLFPAHSSALLQPLDLGPNGALKQHLTTHFKPIEGENMADYRNRLLHCVKRGLTVALSEHVCRLDWERTGISPFKPEIPLGSAMVRDRPAQPWLQNAEKLQLKSS